MSTKTIPTEVLDHIQECVLIARKELPHLLQQFLSTFLKEKMMSELVRIRATAANDFNAFDVRQQLNVIHRLWPTDFEPRMKKYITFQNCVERCKSLHTVYSHSIHDTIPSLRLKIESHAVLTKVIIEVLHQSLSTEEKEKYQSVAKQFMEISDNLTSQEYSDMDFDELENDTVPISRETMQNICNLEQFVGTISKDDFSSAKKGFAPVQRCAQDDDFFAPVKKGFAPVQRCAQDDDFFAPVKKRFAPVQRCVQDDDDEDDDFFVPVKRGFPPVQRCVQDDDDDFFAPVKRGFPPVQRCVQDGDDDFFAPVKRGFPPVQTHQSTHTGDFSSGTGLNFSLNVNSREFVPAFSVSMQSIPRSSSCPTPRTTPTGQTIDVNARHKNNSCTPCNYFFTKGRCMRGAGCSYCHDPSHQSPGLESPTGIAARSTPAINQPVLHNIGECNPCRHFFGGKRICHLGSNCGFCHDDSHNLVYDPHNHFGGFG